MVAVNKEIRDILFEQYKLRRKHHISPLTLDYIEHIVI